MATAAIVCADIHARPGERAFADFLAGLAHRPPCRLLILGDLFDYWLETDDCVRSHAVILAGLRRLHAAGWRLDLVLGNREVMADRRLEIAGGTRLHWPTLEATFGGRRFRFVHGDRLLPDPAYRLWSTWMHGLPMRLWSRCVPGFVQDRIARLLRGASSRRQHLTRRGIRRRLGRPWDHGRLRAAAAGAAVLVGGHLHVEQHLCVEGVEVWILGDWSAGRSRWLEIDDDGSCRFCPTG